MDPRLDTVTDLLLELERELRRLELWQREHPGPAAVGSPQPFCWDTLELWQWLQWVFIPRLTAMVEEHGTLPDTCRIAPYAEEQLKGVVQETTALLTLLETLDRTICASGAQ